jgi:FKBP-type peptidyl-prolyl cis-trans isomerase
MKYTLLILAIAIFTSCDSDTKKFEVKDYRVENEAEIKTYIEDNDLNAQKSETGLYYVIEEEGTGEQPTMRSNVTVAYKGYFTNSSSPFDQSEAYTTRLTDVIPGWTEGIPYFKEGGKGKLLIPSHLAYGAYGKGSIPGGAVLIFDIELISIN